MFVTNGYMTVEALEKIAPYLDAANVDLKSFREEFYRKDCGARLEPVLECITCMREKGIWPEITTLVIPGENDSEEELDDLAAFVARTGTDIPWHISRFQPGYRWQDRSSTPRETLDRAARAAASHGIEHVHLGNV